MFYVYKGYYRECSLAGPCSDGTPFVGLATESDLNSCDFIQGRAMNLFNLNSYNVDAPYPPNMNFTIEHTGAYCDTNALSFNMTCDG